MKFLLIIMFAFSIPLVAQQVKKDKPLSKKKADAYFSIGIYKIALPTYLKLLKKEGENGELNLKAGICLFNSSAKNEAIPYLEKATLAGEATAYFYLGQVMHYDKKFDKALEDYLLFKRDAAIDEYLEQDVDRHIAITQRAIKMIANPTDVKIENLGTNINSVAGDYVPLINADESVLIFTSRRKGSTGGGADAEGHYFEDVYYSLKEGGTWGKATNIGEAINTPSHDASVSISADGQKLIIYRMDQGSYGGDLYLSTLHGEKWSLPEKFKAPINSPYWEPSACMSADEKLLFFASNRPGGYGGRDIYMCRRLPDNSWGLPVNLGGIINTPFDDDAPFLHPDGKTLYFSSQGHNTMGGFDIFKSEMEDNALWTLPENIGYPINTVGDDIYFVLSTDGKKGYFSSDREGSLGDQDIYVAHFPDESIPLAVLKGRVLDEETKTPLNNAVLTIIDKKTKEVQGIYRPNTASGKFIVVLPPDHSFKVFVEAEGYRSKTEDINYGKDGQFVEILKDILLQPID